VGVADSAVAEDRGVRGVVSVRPIIAPEQAGAGRVVESGMSSIEQRIAEVLRAHWPVRDPNGHINGAVPNSVAVYDCWCESITNTTHDAVTDHVASVLIDEIGLTPDKRELPDGYSGQAIDVHGNVTRHFNPCTVETRYVTAWTRWEQA
jgi:hypothetical protein